MLVKEAYALKEQLRELTRDMWNLPNILTIVRLLLVPVFAILYMNGYSMPALAVFIVAAVTDFADGRIARATNQITSFGKLMDPLADKLMVLTTLLCHCLKGVFPWAALCIIAVKEALMILGGIFMLRHGVVVYSIFIGKAATVVFFAALIAAFFHPQLVSLGFPADIWLLWAAVILNLCALVAYAMSALKQLRTMYPRSRH